jgi:hypothetical protein
MPPLLPSSGAINVNTIRSYLGISTGLDLNSAEIRRIRGDSKGIPYTQNPVNMSDLYGANVRGQAEYRPVNGVINGYIYRIRVNYCIARPNKFQQSYDGGYVWRR